MLVKKIKLDESYLSYVKRLIKEKQFLKNTLILLYERTKNFDFLDYSIIRALVFSTKGGKKQAKINELKKKYKEELKEFDLTRFNFFKNKLVDEIVKELNANYKTSFKLLKKGEMKKFSLKPRKLSKVFYGNILIPNECILKYLDNIINLSIYSTKHNKGNKLSIYCNFEKIHLKIKQIRVYSLQLIENECYLNITYKEDKKSFKQLKEKAHGFMGIDPGLNNHLTVVDTNMKSNSLLIRSSSINRINNSTGKIVDIINSKIDKLKKSKKKIRKNKINSLIRIKHSLFIKRDKIINQELHKIAKRIIDHCIKFNLKTVVYGYNKNQKKNINIGKRNNRLFLEFPHEKFKNILIYLLPLYEINLVLQEESYTSKLSCLSDEVWKYDIKHKPTESHGLRGICINKNKITSLFKDKKLGIIFHADVNGAFNIILKYKQKAYKKLHLYLNKLCNPILIKSDYDYLNYLRRTFYKAS